MSYNAISIKQKEIVLEFLTVKETATILRIHPDHLTRIARQGKIDFVKLGRKYGFTEQHIKDYIERSSAK